MNKRNLAIVSLLASLSHQAWSIMPMDPRASSAARSLISRVWQEEAKLLEGKAQHHAQARSHWSQLDAKAQQQGLAELLKTFPEPKQKLLEQLSRYFSHQDTGCPQMTMMVQQYVSYLAGLPENHQRVPEHVLAPLEKLSPDRIRCLVLAFRVTSPPRTPKEEKLLVHALEFLLQKSKTAQDFVVLTALAEKYMEQNRYPATLKILLKLQAMNSGFRLIYDSVQRIYSFRHQGTGEVALQNM